MACSVAKGVSIEPKESECSICSEPFREPKLLPCGHLLCGQCLLTWMRTQDEARCPLCRDIIVGRKDRRGQSLEDLVSGLPTDLSMELILQADRILRQPHNCCVCEDVAATAMCLICRDMLCPACEKVHGKLSFTKHHLVEDVSTLTAEKLTANYCAPCSTHPEEIPRLFCPSHGHSICLMCASSKHRDCPELKDLSNQIEESRTLLQQLSAELTEGEMLLDQALNDLDEHVHNLEKYAETAIAEIEQMCDDLNTLVNKNRHQMIVQVVDVCSAVREAMKEGKNHMLQKQTKLTTHKRVIERVGGVKNRAVVSTMSVKMKKRVDELIRALPEDAKVDSAFKFIQNPDAMTRIMQLLTQLGEVMVVAPSITANIKVSLPVVTRAFFSSTFSETNVRIDKKSMGRPLRARHDSLLVGVATTPADSMVMPSWSGEHNWTTWICPLFTACSGSGDYSNRIGAALVSLGETRCVGLALDSARCVHLYVDGEDQGIAARNLPDPCYAMFDIVDEYEQITALPVTRLGQ
ncbi:hypothetical protein ACOMHN_007620 [Nucella lapillus]